MYLYRPLWVYAVRGWATLLTATLALGTLLAAWTGTFGMLNQPGVVAMIAFISLLLAAALSVYLWAVTERAI